ncbi:MAG TPA: DUF427 domain-containing protein [Stellaceae bacterium]|nr:DUF427 domain-containing protein [Stellaceae bacterium]
MKRPVVKSGLCIALKELVANAALSLICVKPKAEPDVAFGTSAWRKLERLRYAQTRVKRRAQSFVEISLMKATLSGHVIAESNDIVECKGYQYFPRSSVRLDQLEKAEKTASDLECPHGVQFYDVIVDGKRHRRAAWSYEAPQPKMRQVTDRFGFWEDVQVG